MEYQIQDGKEMVSNLNSVVWMCIIIVVGIKMWHPISFPVWIYNMWNLDIFSRLNNINHSTNVKIVFTN
jgi:hypothetical protein